MNHYAIICHGYKSHNKIPTASHSNYALFFLHRHLEFCWRFFHEYELQPSTSPNQNLVIYFFCMQKKHRKTETFHFRIYHYATCIFFIRFCRIRFFSTFVLPRSNETTHFERQITIQILIIILNILWHPINCKHSNANKIAGLNYDCKLFFFIPLYVLVERMESIRPLLITSVSG